MDYTVNDSLRGVRTYGCNSEFDWRTRIYRVRRKQERSLREGDNDKDSIPGKEGHCCSPTSEMKATASSSAAQPRTTTLGPLLYLSLLI